MSIFTYANPQRFLRFVHYVLLPLLLIGGVISAVGLYAAFALAPADYQQGETVRIMYIHVPAAWLLVGVGCAAHFGACVVSDLLRHSRALECV